MYDVKMSYCKLLNINVFKYHFRKTRSVGGYQDKMQKCRILDNFL